MVYVCPAMMTFVPNGYFLGPAIVIPAIGSLPLAHKPFDDLGQHIVVQIQYAVMVAVIMLVVIFFWCVP